MAGFAICAIARDEAAYIQEWIAFHRLQGASRFCIYNNSNTGRTLNLIRRARGRDIEVIDWSFPAEHFDGVQRRAYLDGARRLAGEVDFAAFLDIDEFLFAQDGRGLLAALDDFGSEVGAIAVNQRIFGSSGQRRYRNRYVTSRFIKTTRSNHPESRWFKTIARPERMEAFTSVHSVQLNDGRYVLADGEEFDIADSHPGCAARIASPARLGLHHYMLKSREEYEWKRRKWSDTKLSARYDDAYFDERDAEANEATVPTLARYCDQIDEMIGTTWPSARFGIAAQRVVDRLMGAMGGRSPESGRIPGAE